MPNRDQGLVPTFSEWLSQREASIGVSVNETSSENSVAATTVRPNWRKSGPSTPLT